jgi:small subunit ribosomal protein S16
MSVVIRMKKMGRKNRHYFRICATDPRNPRDGRIIEAVGTYDPHIADTDARVTFDAERLQYWLGVGAKPSEKVAVLIRKYGPGGSHVDEQKAAQEKRAGPKQIKDPGAPKWTLSMKQQEEAKQTEGHPAAGAEETESAIPAGHSEDATAQSDGEAVAQE